MLLEKFKTAKQPEIQALRQLEYINMLPLPLRIERPSFLDALRAPNGNRPHVIAEFKRASPSRGDILMDFPPEEAAKQYAEAGASCLSMLTEETYFKGTLGYLKRMSAPGLPLLRKDFIFDRLQVAATAATPASALLLIVRLTPDATLLRSLREQAEAHGIDAVVEIFDEADLALARESGARIIQVNARDLDTLQVDRSACLRLAERFHQAGDNEADCGGRHLRFGSSPSGRRRRLSGRACRDQPHGRRRARRGVEGLLMGKGKTGRGETFLKKSFLLPSPGPPSLLFQRLLRLSNPCLREYGLSGLSRGIGGQERGDWVLPSRFHQYFPVEPQ